MTTKYFKVLNDTENHHNLQYVTGLNIDPVPFSQEGSCCPGGIYFTTTKFLPKFLYYGPYVREVTVPEDALMVRDPENDKWRASKVILGPRMDLRETSTWKLLIENGLNVHTNEDYALCWASSCGDLPIVRYLVEECGADVHACDGWALRGASKQGHLPVVKYLIEVCGVDVHVWGDEAWRGASLYGYTEVAEYLKSQP